MKTAMHRHIAAIRAGEVTATNVIGLRKAFNALERERQIGRKVKGAPTFGEVDEATVLMHEHAPRVTGELHDTGLKTLRNPRYAKRFDEFTRLMIEDYALEFRLVGYSYLGRRGEYSLPVFKACSRHGSFLFRNLSWQSGGDGPEIVGEDF